MRNTYVECLVDVPTPVGKKILFVFVTAVTILLLLLAAVVPLIGLLAVAGAIAVYFIWQGLHIEYEYCLMEDELTVDKVIAQAKRKSMASYSMDKLEIVAPVGSSALLPFRNREGKGKDFSGGSDSDQYVMYCAGQRVLLTPSKALLKALKQTAPYKVFTE